MAEEDWGSPRGPGAFDSGDACIPACRWVPAGWGRLSMAPVTVSGFWVLFNIDFSRRSGEEDTVAPTLGFLLHGENPCMKRLMY